MRDMLQAARAAAIALLLIPSAYADAPADAKAEWRAYVDGLAPLGENAVKQMPSPSDPQRRQEVYRELFSQIAAAYNVLLFADPEHPDLISWIGPANRILGPNPDDDYYMTPVQGDGVYKLTGFRGTVLRVDVQISGGSFVPRGVVDETRLGPTFANHDLDSLHLSKDGAFEVVISAKRPEGWTGDWWELDPKATYLLMRQVSYDWLREVDGRFAIERVDRPAVKPRPDAARIQKDIAQIPTYVDTWLTQSIAFGKLIHDKRGWVNQMGYIDLTANYGGMVTQKYAYGAFALAPDEALIVEGQMPEHCRYWSIQLTDDLFFSIDWVNRQSNLNGYMVKADKDGRFRIVISAQDPGVPNWLDTAGYASGFIQARWESCSSWPDHKVTKVKTADVRGLVPADTPVVTAEARDSSVRERRRAAQMRKRW